jgi:hypothetical protein
VLRYLETPGFDNMIMTPDGNLENVGEGPNEED